MQDAQLNRSCPFGDTILLIISKKIASSDWLQFHYTKDLKKEKIQKSFIRPRRLKFALFPAKILWILADATAPPASWRAGLKPRP